jgi:DNA repair exonuclease SbcCD ATPase subunit
MAKSIISPEIVFETASLLVSEGVEPSIINVQTRIGGGSYTTIKKYLDEWKRMRSEKTAVEVPPEITSKGNLLIEQLWSAASGLADRAVQTIKEQTQVEKSQTEQELADAINELHRLERLETDLQKNLTAKDNRIHDLELKIASLEVEAKQAKKLQTELDTVRSELARSQQQVRDLVERGKQASSLESVLAELKERFGQIPPPSSNVDTSLAPKASATTKASDAAEDATEASTSSPSPPKRTQRKKNRTTSRSDTKGKNP